MSFVSHVAVADPGGGAKGAMAPPSVLDKDYLLCSSWHFLVKNSLKGSYFIFFQKNFQPRFARHEYYSSFPFFWSHSAHYFIHISSSYVHTFTLY